MTYSHTAPKILVGTCRSIVYLVPEFSFSLSEMSKDTWDMDELRRRLAFAHAELARHERLTGIILGCLTFLAVMAAGLLIGHIAGVPWLSHR